MSLRKIDFKKNLKVYIFGSCLNTEDNHDIDLFIIYGKKYTVEEAIVLRHQISDLVSKQYNTFADICLLSENEKEYKSYIRKEKALEIYHSEESHDLNFETDQCGEENGK
jgi:predicted nucleotidyltransferase